MKKTLIILLALVTFVALPESAVAQVDLTKALGGLLGGSSKSSSAATSPYKKLADAAPAASTLYGSWSYDSATFTYVGSNPLADIVIAQLDPVILDVLKQMSVSRGSATLKLDSGKGSITQAGSTLEGEYTYQRSTAGITVSAIIDGKSVSVSGYVKYAQSMLTVLLDVKQMLKAVKTVYPEYKNDQNVLLVESLLKDLGDVYVVGKFKKQ